MKAANSRFIAVWASHEARARIWLRLFVVTLACLVLSLFDDPGVESSQGGHSYRV